jgi:hypothetical protein
MKKMQFMTVWLIMGILIAPNIYGTDFENSLNGSLVGDNAILSGRGSMTFSYARVDSMGTKAEEEDRAFRSNLASEMKAVIRNSENIEISFIFDGPKIKFIEKSTNIFPDGKTFPQHWQWAYNGEKLDLLRLDGLKDGIIVPMGSVRTANEIPVHKFDPRHFGMGIMGTPVNSFLKGSLGGNAVKDLEIIGEETQNSIICKKFRGNIPDSKSTITAWLAPNLMYRPVKIEIESFDEIIEVQNSYKEHLGGVWFPKKVHKKTFYINSKSEKVLYAEEILQIQDDFEVNVEFDAQEFELEFPRGLKVYDYRIAKYIDID